MRSRPPACSPSRTRGSTYTAPSGAGDERAVATRRARSSARNPVARERLTYDRSAKAVTQRSDKSAPATGGRTRRGHRRTGRPPLSPRHDAHPPRPAAGGQRPSGGAAAADRRRRPPRVPLRLRRRGHCRVHHARLPTPRCPRASGPLTLRDHAGTVDVRGRPTAASPRALPAPRHRPDPGPKSPRGTPAPRRTGRRPQTGACEAGDRGRYSAHRDCVSYPALVSSAALGDAPTRTTLIERSISGSASVEGDAAVAVAGEADCWR